MAPPKNALAAKLSDSKVNDDELDRRIAMAEMDLQSVADGFADWAASDIAAALKELDRVENGAGDEESLKSIFRIAHDIKGQGSTFGFPLVTEISAPLCDFLRSISAVPSTNGIIAVKAHLTALHVVLEQNIKGDGGAMGRQLLDKLAAVMARAV